MTKKRIMLGTAAAGFVALLIAALTPTSPAAAVTPQQALAAALAGQYNCTMVDQVNGFTLTCTTPTSPSPTSSPSASSSPTLSPSPTVVPTTTSPAPSPSGTNCLSRLAACGFPNVDNTGPTGSLAVVSGNVTLSTAGMVYERKDVRGCITVTAPNVVMRNVKVSGCGDYVRVRSNSTNLVLSDVEIDCGGGFGHGVGFANYTLLRADVHDCENGGDVSSPGNVTVRDSWIHNLRGGSGAHFDGLQFGQGAANITVEHSVIYNPNNQTSAIIMWDEGGSQNRDVRIANNLLAGANYTLRCGRTDPAVNVVITGNRFGPNEAGYDKSNACNSGEVWSGNVLDSTGAPLAAA